LCTGKLKLDSFNVVTFNVIFFTEQTFWWNHLQEDTFPPPSLIYNDETARQLSVNSQIDSSQDASKWWKNLERSDNAHIASTSSRHNLSAGTNPQTI